CVRRFALHILPKGLVRIRQYGLLANRDRGQRLAQCRALLPTQAGTAAAAPPGPRPGRPSPSLALCLLTGLFLLRLTEGHAALPPTPAELLAAFQAAARRCPACGLGTLEILWEARRPTAWELERIWHWDTS